MPLQPDTIYSSTARQGCCRGFCESSFRANQLLDGVYAEPYAGGASIAPALLFEEHASTVYINDIDPAVYAFGDHKAIADSLAKARFHWLVSYDNVPDIRALYSRYRRVTYELRYTAAERHSGAEVMLFSPGLVVDSAVRSLLPGSSRLVSCHRRSHP